ncbi:MAG: hypothetical protein Q8L99_08335 [Polycyclovorans sp.]|nr:hypothetical protein [Polycyclovorans sp.]
MTRDEARAILEAHNKWRRGDDTIPNDPPWALGRAIDVAVEELAKPAAVPYLESAMAVIRIRKAIKDWESGLDDGMSALAKITTALAASPQPPEPAADVEAARVDATRYRFIRSLDAKKFDSVFGNCPRAAKNEALDRHIDAAMNRERGE